MSRDTAAIRIRPGHVVTMIEREIEALSLECDSALRMFAEARAHEAERLRQDEARDPESHL